MTSIDNLSRRSGYQGGWRLFIDTVIQLYDYDALVFVFVFDLYLVIMLGCLDEVLFKSLTMSICCVFCLPGRISSGSKPTSGSRL